MYSLDILKESLSKECFNEVLDIIEEFIQEEKKWTALGQITGSIPDKVKEHVGSAIMNAGRSALDHMTGHHQSPDDINAEQRHKAAVAANEYRNNRQAYSQHMNNTPDENTPAGLQLAHKVKGKALAKKVSDSYKTYQDERSKVAPK